MNAARWLKSHKHGVTIAIKVQPNAKETRIIGLHGDTLKVKIGSPAVDGKANQKLFDYLAHTLNVKAYQISLLSGERNREKVVLVEGISEIQVRSIVDHLLCT